MAIKSQSDAFPARRKEGVPKKAVQSRCRNKEENRERKTEKRIAWQRKGVRQCVRRPRQKKNEKTQSKCGRRQAE